MNDVLNPTSIVNFLGRSSITVLVECANPVVLTSGEVVPVWFLRTLSLFDAESTNNTLTSSLLVPIPTVKISFSRISVVLRVSFGNANLPLTLK